MAQVHTKQEGYHMKACKHKPLWKVTLFPLRGTRQLKTVQNFVNCYLEDGRTHVGHVHIVQENLLIGY